MALFGCHSQSYERERLSVERCQPSPAPPVPTSRRLLEGASNHLPSSCFPCQVLRWLPRREGGGGRRVASRRGGPFILVSPGWEVTAGVAGKRHRRTRRSSILLDRVMVNDLCSRKDKLPLFSSLLGW